MQGHIRSILPQKGGVAPVDNNTVFYAPYDSGTKDILCGHKAIGHKDALRFNGSDTYVDVSDFRFRDFTQITLSLWVCPFSWNSHRALLTSRVTTGDGLIFFALSGTDLTIDLGGSVNRWSTGYLPPLNTWTHLAYTHDGTAASLYVNGELQNSTTTLGNPSAIHSDKPLRIGADTRSIQYCFDGYIQNVFVWGKALSPSSIKKAMYGSESQAKGYWPLNEGEGILAYDYSDLGNDGIIANPEWGTGKSQYELTNKGVLLEEETTNIIPLESLTFENGWSDYSGATVTRTQGIPVSEWSTNDATRIQVLGGTSTIVSHIDLMSHHDIESGRQFAAQVKIKNMGANSVYVYSNRQSTFINSGIVRAGESRNVKWVTDSNAIGSGGNLQIQLRTLSADIGKELDFIAFQPQVEEKTYHTSFIAGSRSNSHLQYPTPLESNTDFTVSFWVYPFEQNSSFGTNQILTMANPDSINTNTFNIDIFENKFRAFVYDSAGNSKVVSSTVTPEPEKWKHIAVSKGQDLLRLYTNGALEDSAVVTGIDYEIGNVMAIGERIAGGTHNGRFLNGVIDELRIDKVARTAEEIQAWYHHGRKMM